MPHSITIKLSDDTQDGRKLKHYLSFLAVSLAEVLQSLADKVITGPEIKITIDPDDLIADTIAFILLLPLMLLSVLECSIRASQLLTQVESVVSFSMMPQKQ